MNAHDRVSFLMACLREQGFVGVASCLQGTLAWQKHCYEQGSEEAEALIEQWMEQNLSSSAIEAVKAREVQREALDEYNEIMSDSETELDAQRRLDMWCQGDPFTECYHQWRNEY